MQNPECCPKLMLLMARGLSQNKHIKTFHENQIEGIAMFPWHKKEKSPDWKLWTLSICVQLPECQNQRLLSVLGLVLSSYWISIWRRKPCYVNALELIAPLLKFYFIFNSSSIIKLMVTGGLLYIGFFRFKS